MNQLSDFRAKKLESAFLAEMSLRKAALECGVNRNTAMCYFKKFRAGWRSIPRRSRPIVGIAGEVSHDSYLALEREAMERTMTIKELIGNIVENAARDNLFAGILDI